MFFTSNPTQKLARLKNISLSFKIYGNTLLPVLLQRKKDPFSLFFFFSSFFFYSHLCIPIQSHNKMVYGVLVYLWIFNSVNITHYFINLYFMLPLLPYRPKNRWGILQPCKNHIIVVLCCTVGYFSVCCCWGRCIWLNVLAQYYTTKHLFHQSLCSTATTWWLDSDGVVTVFNCEQYSD